MMKIDTNPDGRSTTVQLTAKETINSLYRRGDMKELAKRSGYSYSTIRNWKNTDIGGSERFESAVVKAMVEIAQARHTEAQKTYAVPAELVGQE